MSYSNEKWVDELWEMLDKKMQAVAKRCIGTIPYTVKEGTKYDDMAQTNINFWTNGFWPGLMWIMYNSTGNEIYKETAENAEKLLDKAFHNYDKLHHDVGFLWHISAGANYRLTGNRESYVRNMFAANVLAGRYNIKGEFIRAWNQAKTGDARKGWAIIDCMMNIPILYWASSETGDERYKYIAMSHADKTLKHHVRDDGSVNHIVCYNPETGEEVETLGGQGYGVGSSWSRGQAWGIYGFTLSYIHTAEKRYLDAAKKIANYFIAACCDDYLPKSDFRSPEEPVLYDASAGLIAACGLIELSRAVPEYESKMYYNAAIRFIKAITDEFADWSEDSDAVITHCSESYSKQKHMSLIYADFYLAEALNKLKGINTFLW